jgi:hypothetical protein
MRHLVLGVFLALVLSIGHAPAKVYVWKDEAGVRHYTDTPPPQGATIIKTFEEVPATPAPEPREPAQNTREVRPAADPTGPSGDETGRRVPVGELAIEKANREKAEALIAQERKRLNERLVVLNSELEWAQTEQYRSSSYSSEQWAARIEQIQSEIQDEVESSARRIAEIKKEYDLD